MTVRIDVPRLSRSETIGRLSSLAADEEIAPVGRQALRTALHARIDDEGLCWILRCAYDVAAHLRTGEELARIVDESIHAGSY